MAQAYSQDLRIRALNLIKSGMSITDISRLLCISRPTLYKWQSHFISTGSTSAKKPDPPTWISKIKDWEKFREFVTLHGDKTQEEIARLWGNCSRHTISRGLKKIGYTRKKKR
jgi:transposase